jgi:hypothetical protein
MTGVTSRVHAVDYGDKILEHGVTEIIKPSNCFSIRLGNTNFGFVN